MTATPAEARQSRNIPSLDGLRAVSILGVLCGHVAGTRGFPEFATSAFANPLVDLAGLGVRVFFVISGFLITRLLMDEHRRYGRIDLKRFYLRRVLRIFPAYYVLVAALIAMSAAGLLVLTTSDVVHSLTYTINYSSDRSWSVGHLWSLAVEEQFYLLWPLTLVVVGLRGGRLVALAVILLAPLLRLGEGLILASDVVGNTFETTADALAVGCLVALTERELSSRDWFNWIVNAGWVIVGALLVGLALTVYEVVGWAVGLTVTEVAIGFAMLHLIRHPEGILGRVLNLRPVAFFGVMSYSIYLWQQVFLNRTAPGPLTSFPVNIGLVILLAAISYFAVERPFLRLRPRAEARLLGAAGRRPERSTESP